MAQSKGTFDLSATPILLPTDSGTPSRNQSPSNLDVPTQPLSRRTPDTKYEFIAQTGIESTTAVRQKLKTVRSHVMKNYLHQQQTRNEGGDSLHQDTVKVRRRSKQRTRCSRSTSRTDTQSPAHSAESPSASHVDECGQPTSNFYFLGPMFDLRLEDNYERREWIALFLPSSSLKRCIEI